MPIRATHSDGRSVRRGTLTVDADGLVFEPDSEQGTERLVVPASSIGRTSVEGRPSRWDVVPRRRVRLDTADGAVHRFVVHEPDAVVALVDAATAVPPPHPEVLDRKRRRAGRGSPLGFLRWQVLLGLLLLAGAVSRALERGSVGAPDVVLVVVTTSLVAFALVGMWRYRRYRLSP